MFSALLWGCFKPSDLKGSSIKQTDNMLATPTADQWRGPLPSIREMWIRDQYLHPIFSHHGGNRSPRMKRSVCERGQYEYTHRRGLQNRQLSSEKISRQCDLQRVHISDLCNLYSVLFPELLCTPALCGESQSVQNLLHYHIVLHITSWLYQTCYSPDGSELLAET